jgi:DNA-binding transcriptional LysR family regulator
MPTMLDHLSDVVTFVRVADARSFTLAAEQLGISRSAAGKSIARLEESLATRLIHRTTRSVTLSEEGWLFYEHANRILAEVEEVEVTFARRNQVPQGRLRIDMPVSLGRMHILPLVHTFLAKWPKVEADITFSDDYNDLVRDGIDLAIRVGGRDDSLLMRKVLAPHRLVTVASPSYLKTNGVPRALDELAGHKAIVFTHSNLPVPWRFRANGEDRELAVAGRMRLSNAEAARDAALSGLGIAQLGAFLVSQDIRYGRLVCLFEELSRPGQPVCAVYPTKRHLSPKVRAFIDEISIQWNRSPPWD